MRKLFSILFLLMLVAGAVAQSIPPNTNALYFPVGDLGISPQNRMTETLTLVAPNPRIVTLGNGTQIGISQNPITRITDTNGYAWFTNIQYGSYNMSLSGFPGTVFPLYVGTNTSGTVDGWTLYTNAAALPPDPTTNYYTQAQINALLGSISSFTNIGITNFQSSVTLGHTNGSMSGNVFETNFWNLKDSSGNIRFRAQAAGDNVNYGDGTLAFSSLNGEAQIYGDGDGSPEFQFNTGGQLLWQAVQTVVGNGQVVTNQTSTGFIGDFNVPNDAATFALLGAVTNEAVAAASAATNALGTAAFKSIGTFAQTANNASDFASALLTSSNIATLTVSNQTTLLPNGAYTVPASNGRFPGQLAITMGAGGGGGGFHQLFIWNTNGGTSGWDTGLQVPGSFEAYSTLNLGAGAGAGHWLAVSNSNNSLEIAQLNTNAYSAIGFADQNNLEQFAFGFGESNAAGGSYRGIIYLGDNTSAPFWLTDNHGYPKWGSPGLATPSSPSGTFGSFVVLTNTATNYYSTNVVFSVDQSGNVNASGNVNITNSLTTATSSTTLLQGTAYVGQFTGAGNPGRVSGWILATHGSNSFAVGPISVDTAGSSGASTTGTSTGMNNRGNTGVSLGIGAYGEEEIILGGPFASTIGDANDTAKFLTNVVFAGPVTANVGIGAIGQPAPAAVTLGASPATFTNPGATTLNCFITGSVAYSVALSGVTIYGSLVGDSYVPLEPGKSIVITYSVAPTVTTNRF
jgi:hypothetical protein